MDRILSCSHSGLMQLHVCGVTLHYFDILGVSLFAVSPGVCWDG